METSSDYLKDLEVWVPNDDDNFQSPNISDDSDVQESPYVEDEIQVSPFVPDAKSLELAHLEQNVVIYYPEFEVPNFFQFPQVGVEIPFNDKSEMPIPYYDITCSRTLLSQLPVDSYVEEIMVNYKRWVQAIPQQPLVYDFFNFGLTVDMPESLIFESRFECGNLQKVYYISSTEYDLILRPDLNTVGLTQWFYFSVRNNRCGISYHFNIVNFIKDNSIYNNGMRPVVYSIKKALAGGGWHHSGSNICYYQNPLWKNTRGSFSLSFDISFEYQDDTIFIACSLPYTYSDLKSYLQSINHPECTISTLCKTLAGNQCFMLTIGQQLEDSKCVVITGRVHPGETVGSWMVKGLIDYLLLDDDHVKCLRKLYTFYIIPMLNPDGVIIGNYRTNLNGDDLNRCWQNPNPIYNSTIFATKKLINSLHESKEILAYIDFHGHSRKLNTFMYGCKNKKNSKLFKFELIFPLLMSYNSGLFYLDECRFKMQKSRECTGRIVVRKEFEVVFSYTIEGSLCGNSRTNSHYSPDDLESLGRALGKSLYDYASKDQFNSITETLGIGGEVIRSRKYIKKKKSMKKKKRNKKKDNLHFITNIQKLIENRGYNLPGSSTDSFKLPPISPIASVDANSSWSNNEERTPKNDPPTPKKSILPSI